MCCSFSNSIYKENQLVAKTTFLIFVYAIYKHSELKYKLKLNIFKKEQKCTHKKSLN